MKKNMFLLLAASVLFGTIAQAQRPTLVVGPGLNSGRTIYHQNFSRSFSNDTTYILTGLYTVDSTFSLTIEQGTVIKGDTAACLIVSRGAQIFANGTVQQPIVFTSNKPAGTRSGGDWGGVVILGRAPANQTNPVIEGGILPGSYGGPTAGTGDPNDNSGTFRYVRIEYPGYRFQLNNEVNGLTMGGVGRMTTIEYVQVSYSYDDGFEWFGGTVDARYLVCLGGIDDEFDTDFGYQGRVQFAFGLKDPNVFEFVGGQTNGFESDNEGSASYTNPRTFPRFSNISIVGPRRTDAITLPVGHRFEYCAVVRKGSMLSLYNSIVMGFPGGYSLRDAQSMTAAQGDTLQARNISLQADGPLLPVHSSGTPPPGFSASTWFNTVAYSNLGGAATRLPSTIGLVDMSNLNAPDPRPGVGSEPATAGVEFTNLNLLAGGYFTPTTYRGAFDPSLPMNQQWTAGWTQFDPQNYDPEQIAVATSMGTPWNMVAVSVLPGTFSADALFPGKNGTMFAYNNGTGSYVASTTLANGPGYWANYATAQNNTIVGSSISGQVITAAAAGWVLIGSVTNPVSAGALVTSPPGQISAGPFRFNSATQSYVLTPTLAPGDAHWVFVNAPCTITIP